MTEIPKEELERIEKEADLLYPIPLIEVYNESTIHADREKVDRMRMLNVCYQLGAKAEHSHLQGRIAEKAQSFASWVANWAEYHEKMAKTKLSFKELWNIYKSVNP